MVLLIFPLSFFDTECNPLSELNEGERLCTLGRILVKSTHPVHLYIIFSMSYVNHGVGERMGAVERAREAGSVEQANETVVRANQ